MWYSIMGYIATALAIMMFVPQTIKTVKEKHGGTLSKITFSLVFFGCALWVVYAGLLKHTVVDGELTSYLSVLPGFITNTTIMFLMVPILWYVITDRKVFMAIMISAFGILILGFIFLFSDIIHSVPEVVKYLFVIGAGSCTGLPYIPQTIRIIKDKNIGNVSLLLVILLIVSNTFWVLYWGGMLGSNSSDGTLYISTFFSFMGLATNIPSLIIYVNNRKKSKA